jgi:hypothetical protein
VWKQILGCIGAMERQTSVVASRQYLLSLGFSHPEITKIEGALDRSEMAPGEWLGTLKGLAMDELKQIAVAEMPPDDAPPVMEASPEPELRGGGGGAGDAVDAAPSGMDLCSPAAPPQEEESALCRQYSARTEEFLNHRKVEAERSARRNKIHMEKLDRFGDGPVVVAPSARFKTGTSDTIGHRRTMEDCITLCGSFRGRPEEDLMCVFDGHGGSAVAEYCAMHITQVVQVVMDGAPAGGTVSVPQQFEQAFRQLNAVLSEQLGEEAMESGSTAVVLLVMQDTIHVANVGDARSVLGASTPHLT